jgi:two-component system chemotaxis response regulator CheB
MARRDLVVIGASAGGVDTLSRVVAGLPADLAATVCIVLHIAPTSPSALAQILQRAGRLPCRQPRDGESMHAGVVLVATPDHHLVIEDGRARLTVGPRENGHRPSVDVLFRSAAADRGSRVIGVILSGTRDDGTAGLAAIKAHGGGTIVQDPDEALYPGMPASAIANVAVDAVAPSREIAGAIVAMVNGAEPPTDPDVGAAAQERDPGGGVVSICPDCGGVLTEHLEAGVPQLRCRVGHRYSWESLADAQARQVEGALWSAVRALEDRSALLERMAQQAEAKGGLWSARRFRHKGHDAREHAELVRGSIAQAVRNSLRLVGEEGPEGGVDAERSA